MGIPSDKRAKSHSRRTEHEYKKGNLKKEINSLLVAVQNNAIRTNSIQAKIDNAQQNWKCWLCVVKNEMI